MTLIFIAVLALLLGTFLLRTSQRRRRKLGLPNRDVFYPDHRGQPMPARVLDSRVYGVRGKPDCLIRTSEGILPVELKKSERPPAGSGVYPNHMIQVLAYIVLVLWPILFWCEEATGKTFFTVLCSTQTRRPARWFPQPRIWNGFERWWANSAMRGRRKGWIAVITSARPLSWMRSQVQLQLRSVA